MLGPLCGRLIVHLQVRHSEDWSVNSMQFGKQIVIASRMAQGFVMAIVVEQWKEMVQLQSLARACSSSQNVTGALIVGSSLTSETGFFRPSTGFLRSACRCPVLAPRYQHFLICSQRIDLCMECWPAVAWLPHHRKVEEARLRETMWYSVSMAVLGAVEVVLLARVIVKVEEELLLVGLGVQEGEVGCLSSSLSDLHGKVAQGAGFSLVVPPLAPARSAMPGSHYQPDLVLTVLRVRCGGE